MFCGTVHDKMILVEEAEFAVRPVGEDGADKTCVGTAEAVFDELLVPTEFIAKLCRYRCVQRISLCVNNQ